MNRSADSDFLIDAMAALPIVTPDERRALSVRARCRARLERRTAGEWIASIVSVGVSTALAVYVWQLAGAALSLAR